MQQTELVQEKTMLRVKFRITNTGQSFFNQCSQEYSLSGQAVVQVKVIVDKCLNQTNSNYFGYNMLVFIRFVKTYKGDNRTTITFSSEELGVKDKVFVSDDTTWRLLYEHMQPNTTVFEYIFSITVNLDIKPSVKPLDIKTWPFKSLHDDAELTDFELRGEDGAVSMHKAVLAAYSPVFKTMLSGKWRETTEGSVDVPFTSQETLQYFKDYLYLQKLPETGLEQLLLLASYYMMPELENICTVKVLNKLTA